MARPRAALASAGIGIVALATAIIALVSNGDDDPSSAVPTSASVAVVADEATEGGASEASTPSSQPEVGATEPEPTADSSRDVLCRRLDELIGAGRPQDAIDLATNATVVDVLDPTDTTEPVSETTEPVSETTTTTVPENCDVTRVEIARIRLADAAVLSTTLSKAIADGRHDDAKTLYDELLGIDRVNALLQRQELLELLRTGATEAADQGDFERSEELWALANEVDASIDVDRPPLGEQTRIENIARAFDRTFDRLRGDLALLGAVALLTLLGGLVVLRLAAAYVIRRGRHHPPSLWTKPLGVAFVVAYAASIAFFVTSWFEGLGWLIWSGLTAAGAFLLAVALLRHRVVVLAGDRPSDTEEHTP